MIGPHWGGGGGNPSPPAPPKRKKLDHSGVRGNFFYVSLPYSISAPAISGGQKWSPTVFKTKKTSDHWVGWSMHSNWLDFFTWSFGWGGWEENFFHFSFILNMFLQVLNGSPSSAQWVPNVPDVFPIAACFNPIYFAQSPPLLSYIAARKGPLCFNRILYFGGASVVLSCQSK